VYCSSKREISVQGGGRSRASLVVVGKTPVPSSTAVPMIWERVALNYWEKGPRVGVRAFRSDCRRACGGLCQNAGCSDGEEVVEGGPRLPSTVSQPKRLGM